MFQGAFGASAQDEPTEDETPLRGAVPPSKEKGASGRPLLYSSSSSSGMS